MENIGRKTLKTAGLVLLLLAICLVFAMSILGIKNSEKSSFSDSDLIFVRPQIPAESNSFYTLLKATNGLYWPDKLENKLDDLSDNTNWDDSLASDVLEKNRASLNSFDEAMRQPFLLVPEIKTFDQDLSYLETWKHLTHLKSIQFNSLHRAKDDEEALSDAFEILNFGQRIANSGGSGIIYIFGEGTKNLGLACIRQMAADTTLSKTNLDQIIHELDAFGPNQQGLTNALRVEYEIQRNAINDFAKGKLPDTTNSDFERAMTSFAMKPLLNPRRTKMEFAQGDRFLFDDISKPYAEITWSNLPNIDIETDASPFKRLASGNLVGDGLLMLLEPSLQSLARRKSQEDVNLTATRLLLALKIYKMRHGKLPDSLSELVPEFFPQVPLDDFDGKPFRYLLDKKIIYSVGPCLKDLGGKERKDYSDKDYNLTFKIEF